MSIFVDRLARLFALLGGVVLCALIVMTCVSILGRELGTLLGAGIGPINGDFELVEAGIAFTIFAFLPLCQLQGAHASVDIFTSGLPASFNRALRMIIEVVFSAVMILIAWQLFEGTQSKFRSGTTTLLLEFPLWWAYALSLVPAAVAAFVAVYVAAMRVGEMVSGRSILANDTEAEH